MKSWRKKQLRLSLFQVTREVILGGVGGGGGGGGWFCSFFAQLSLVLFIKAQIGPVHNKLAKKENKTKQNKKQTIVTFCEQNIVDL